MGTSIVSNEGEDDPDEGVDYLPIIILLVVLVGVGAIAYVIYRNRTDADDSSTPPSPASYTDLYFVAWQK